MPMFIAHVGSTNVISLTDASLSLSQHFALKLVKLRAKKKDILREVCLLTNVSNTS